MFTTALKMHAALALLTLVWSLSSQVFSADLHNLSTNQLLDPRITSHKLNQNQQNRSLSANRNSNKLLQEAARNLQISKNLTVSSNNNKQQISINSLTGTRQRWRQMELALGEQVASFSQTLRFTLDGLVVSQLSTECRSALDELLDGLKSQSLWATQMVDASARLPSGLLSGTLTELGNFDQCLSLGHRSAGGNKVRGQYCTIQIKPPLIQRARLHTICQRLPPLSRSQIPQDAANQTSTAKLFKILADHSQHFYYAGLRLGVCTPNKCSKSDVQFLLSAYITKYDLFGQVKSCQVLPDSDEDSVSDEDPNSKLDAIQQCIASIFASLLLLVLLGTIVDYASSKTLPKQDCFDMARFPPSNASSESLYITYPNGMRIANQPNGPGARRWLYQVYRPPRSACPLHHNDLKGRPLNLQHNPLSDQKQHQRQGQYSTLQSSSHLFKEPSESTEEASWLVDMDHGSQVMSPTSLLGSSVAPTFRQAVHKQHLQDSHPTLQNSQNSNWSSTVKHLLICFSLRSNLKVILGFTAAGCSAQSPRHGAASNLQELGIAGGDIRVVHGLRTVTMIWIIFGHSIGLVNPEMMNNLFSIAQLSCTSRLLQALLNATLAVNTFFVISGLVTVISLARKCPSVCNQFVSKQQQQQQQQSRSRASDRKVSGKSSVSRSNRHKDHKRPRDKHDHRNNRRKQRAFSSQPLDLSSSAVDSSASSTTSSIVSSLLSSSASSNRCIDPAFRTARDTQWPPADFRPFVWLLLRYLRLTPAYAAVLGASVLLPALGSGPFWQESAGSLGTNCRENWMINLVYANNFVNTDELCLIHSWYLSNDWQFFTWTLVLLAVFYKSKQVALLLLITSMIASGAANFAITVANDFPPTIVTTSPAVAERWLFIHSLYYKPWPHLPSYLIGVITGYLMLQRQLELPARQINQWKSRISWFLFILLALALLNSVYPWNMGLQVDPMLAGLHSTTFRTLWAVCCAWLIYSLSGPTVARNWLAKLLSWHGFQVSSRLTYCLYLVHPLVIYYHFGMLRERLDSSPYGQFHRFIATLGLSYLAALMLTIVVEGPALKLLRLLGSALGVVPENRDGTQATSGYSSSPRDNSWIGSYVCEPQTYGSTNGPAPNPTYVHAHQHAFVDPNQQQKQGAVALDADFQRRLAQAISRGFRVRSRMANGPVGSPVAASGATSRRAIPVSKWPAAVPPAPPPLIERPHRSQPSADKVRKKVEFSTFITPNTSSSPRNEAVSSRNTIDSAPNNLHAANQQRRRSHQDLMSSEPKQPAPNLASLNHQILAQHQKLVSRSKDQL